MIVGNANAFVDPLYVLVFVAAVTVRAFLPIVNVPVPDLVVPPLVAVTVNV